MHIRVRKSLKVRSDPDEMYNYTRQLLLTKMCFNEFQKSIEKKSTLNELINCDLKAKLFYGGIINWVKPFI